MTQVDLQLVRDFFELNRFRVMAHWQQEPPGASHGERGVQLFVENSNVASERELDVVLQDDDIAAIHRAVVEVRAWHTDRFYSSVIESSPALTQFSKPDALANAREFFGTDALKTVLVLSELPVSEARRSESITAFRAAGVDHVIEFPTILRGLLGKVSVNGLYTASPTLQMIQLLKRYRFIRNQQMEFEFPMEAVGSFEGTEVETVEAPEEEGD